MHYIGSIAFHQIVNFLLLPVYSRVLSTTDFGYLGYLQTVIFFVSITNALSLNAFYVRNYYRYEYPGQLTATLFYFLIIINIFFVGFELVLLFYITKFMEIQIPFWPYIVLAFSGYFFTSFNLIPQRYLRMNSFSQQYMLTIVGTVILDNLFSMVLIWYFHWGAEGRLLGSALAGFVMAIYYSVLIFRNAGFHLKYEILKKGLMFSMPLLWGSYALAFLSITDRLILERFIGINQLGVYSMAVLVGTSSKVIINALLIVIESKVYQFEKNDRFNEKFLHLKRYFFFAVASLIGFYILFSKEIVMILLTPEYSNAVWMIPLIAAASFFNASMWLNNQLLMIKNKTAVISNIVSVSAGVNIVANLIFIPYFQILAATMISLLVYIGASFLNALWVKRHYLALYNYSYEIFIAGCFMFLFGIRSLIDSYNIFIILFSKLAFFGIFIGTLILFFKISPKNLQFFFTKKDQNY